MTSIANKKDLRGYNLSGFSLRGADLGGANLSGAYLGDIYLLDANLSDTILEGVSGLNIDQLSRVKTLLKSKLDSELAKQVKEKYPHLLTIIASGVTKIGAKKKMAKCKS